MQRAFNSVFLSTLSLATLGCLIPISVQAQITPDGTTSTTVNQDGDNFTINQGDRIGDNLFHSFDEFSVPTNGSAAFNNVDSIANIFSRVTGINPSNIDGVISANGAANLFLINPNGIIFGQNASLNLGGSFFASTADSLLFEGDAEFSAVNPQAPPLLEVSIPIGASFRDNPGDIVNRSVVQNSENEFIGLQVLPEKNLTLVGGNINFEGGVATTRGGNIELGGLSTAGTVAINNDLSLSFPNNVTRADIFLSNGSFIDVSSGGGGNININTRNLDLTQGALFAGIRPNFGNSEAQAGDINIDATEEINLKQGSRINNSVYIDGTGNSGDININTGSLNLTEGSSILASTFATGSAGKITINALDEVSVAGENQDGFPSGIFSRVEETGVGDGSGIKIDTKNLTLTNSSRIDSSTSGQGNSGTVQITAADVISFENSAVVSDVKSTGEGNAGDIRITTSDLNLTQGGGIDSSTAGKGNAGSIVVDASKNISIDGVNSNGIPSGLFSVVNTGAVGNAEKIRIITPKLSLSKGGQINSSTGGQGNAGEIFIDASNSILIDGKAPDGDVSAVSSGVYSGGVGNGGEIKVSTAKLSITNGGLIISSTLGNGNAGNISVNTSNSILIDGRTSEGFVPGIVNRVEPGAVGKGGDIEITTTNLSLYNDGVITTAIFGEGDAGGIEITTSNLSLNTGGSINASTFGQGNAGGININVFDSISIDGKGNDGFPSDISSTANEQAEGDAGEINVTTNSLTLTNEGLINTSTYTQGDAGAIKVTAEEILLDNGQIFSSTTETADGDAGGIEINTTNLNLANNGAIDVSTFGQGDAGEINIIATGNISVDGESRKGFSNSGIFSTVDETSTGDAGGIEITTDNLKLTNGGQIDASTFGKGNAGGIKISATDTISAQEESQEEFISGIFSTVNETAEGNAGGIEITTANLDLVDGGTINAGTFGRGNGGGINITANDTISAKGMGQSGFSSGIFSTVNETAEGNAGGINLTTSTLNLVDGGTISASTFGKGNAENIIIATSDTISAEGTDSEGFGSGIFSTVNETAEGNAGGIKITTGNLDLIDGGTINAGTFGRGNGGGINITANDTISAKGKGQSGFSSGIFSTVNETAEGNAGGIEITTANLDLIDDGTVNTSTLGKGNAGGINITANDTISIDASSIFSRVEEREQAIGNASSVEINTNNLSLTNGGTISSSTFGKGNAGTVKITATGNIFADGIVQDEPNAFSGIYSRVDEAAEGNSGGIEISTENLTLSNKAEINVGIFGKTNPELESGNLNLTVQDLLILKNSGKISAQATGNNNGGNVTINANDGLIIAFPNQNNDIFANAAQGNGGNINIFTQAIFGLEERRSTPPNLTNDIDASSEFGLQGDFSLNTPDFDPTTGLINLPASVGDASDQISQNPCEQGVGSQFIVTGKGGLPPTVSESLNSETAQVDLIEPISSPTQTVGENGIHPTPKTNTEAVPAQGWVFNDKGEVTLTAYKTTNTEIKRSSQAISNSCSAPKNK